MGFQYILPMTNVFTGFVVSYFAHWGAACGLSQHIWMYEGYNQNTASYFQNQQKNLNFNHKKQIEQL